MASWRVKMKFLIIGNGIAGVSAAEAIRRARADAEITIVSDETAPVYARFLLPWYLGGSVPRHRIWYRSSGWYRNYSVLLLEDTSVSGITAERGRIRTGSGKELPFDKLLLATGRKPSAPDACADLKLHKNYFPLRTIRDAEEIMPHEKASEKIIVIGGGRTGIQTALSLQKAGKKVLLLEQRNKLLFDELDGAASSLLEKELAGRGISVLKESQAIQFKGIPPEMEVTTNKGESLKAHLVISATGTSASLALAKKADLPVNLGIKTNRRLETPVPNIYAAGDVAEIEGRPPGFSWQGALHQGTIAGMNMAGRVQTIRKRFGAFSFTAGTFHIFSYGLVDPWNVAGMNIASRCTGKSYYRKAVIEDGCLIGLLCVGKLEKKSVAGMIWESEKTLDRLTGLPAENPDQVLDRFDLLATRDLRDLSISFSDFPLFFG